MPGFSVGSLPIFDHNIVFSDVRDLRNYGKLFVVRYIDSDKCSRLETAQVFICLRYSVCSRGKVTSCINLVIKINSL